MKHYLESFADVSHIIYPTFILFPIKILDAMLITRAQRTEVYDYFSGQLGYRVLFIECVCDDAGVLEYNQQEIVRHCADYAGVDAALAAEDLRSKIIFYTGIYEPMNDRTYPRIKVDTATMDIETCDVSGHIETSVLGYLGDISLKPHTLYFSRVSGYTAFLCVANCRTGNLPQSYASPLFLSIYMLLSFFFLRVLRVLNLNFFLLYFAARRKRVQCGWQNRRRRGIKRQGWALRSSVIEQVQRHAHSRPSGSHQPPTQDDRNGAWYRGPSGTRGRIEWASRGGVRGPVLWRDAGALSAGNSIIKSE